MGPTTVAVLSAVPVDDAGVGSGVVNTFRQTGGALGIAVMGAIVNGAIHVLPGDPRYPGQFVTGLHDALLAAAGILLIGATAALTLIGSRRELEQRPRPEQRPPTKPSARRHARRPPHDRRPATAHLTRHKSVERIRR
jgi:hypothetical protein